MNSPILTARPGSGSGFPTLLAKELLRFWKVSFQTIAAPVITALLYLVIFAQVLQDHVQVYGSVPYTAFLIPGLMMMSMLQNAFANPSSSLSSEPGHRQPGFHAAASAHAPRNF